MSTEPLVPISREKLWRGPTFPVWYKRRVTNRRTLSAGTEKDPSLSVLQLSEVTTLVDQSHVFLSPSSLSGCSGHLPLPLSLDLSVSLQPSHSTSLGFLLPRRFVTGSDIHPWPKVRSMRMSCYANDWSFAKKKKKKNCFPQPGVHNGPGC